MIIYSASEDVFFNGGLENLASSRKWQFRGIGVNRKDVFNFDRQEMSNAFLIDADCEKKLRFIHNLIDKKYFNINYVFVVDSQINKLANRLFSDQFFFKGLSCESVFFWFENYFNGFHKVKNALTTKERFVLYCLLKQFKAFEIARIMNLSVKTISAHKRNALAKLALRNINQLFKY